MPSPEDWNRYHRELLRPDANAPRDLGEFKEGIGVLLGSLRKTHVERSALWTDLPFTEDVFTDLDETDVDLFENCFWPEEELPRENMYLIMKVGIEVATTNFLVLGSPEQAEEIREALKTLSACQIVGKEAHSSGLFFLSATAWTTFLGREAMAERRRAEEDVLAEVDERVSRLGSLTRALREEVSAPSSETLSEDPDADLPP